MECSCSKWTRLQVSDVCACSCCFWARVAKVIKIQIYDKDLTKLLCQLPENDRQSHAETQMTIIKCYTTEKDSYTAT